MKTKAGPQRRWVFALVGALGVLLAGAILFRAPGGSRTAPLRAVVSSGPAVQLVNLRKNEAALTDPTPLFLPTEWNAGQNALPANTQREPGGAFQGYPAKLVFAETELKLNFPAPVAVPARPADGVTLDRTNQLYLGLGFSERPTPQLIARDAFIEIMGTNDGQRLLARPLTDANPPDGDWRPLEFLVAVDAMGLVGPPILTESSRVTAVDSYFQNYVVKTLHLGQRLAPGFYRVSIGP